MNSNQPMHPGHFQTKGINLLLLFLLAIGFTGPALTWAESISLDETVRQEISIAHTTQEREEGWSAEYIALEAKLSLLTTQKRKYQAEVDALLWGNEKIEGEVKHLKEEVSKARQLTEGLSPLILEEIRRTDSIINQSLPFLHDERVKRLAALKEWIKAPATKQGEKLERLLELLTIETQFGHTCEAWQEEIEVGGKPITAELLKVGRLALFYLTLDEKNCGVFDPNTQKFGALPNNCAPRLRKAMALAKRERSAELVSLPIGRIMIP